MNRGVVLRGVVVVAVVVCLGLLPWASTIRGAAPETARPASTTSVTITVTSALAFTPNTFEVSPGQTVTLTVEQLDSEYHTFTLSSVTNFTFSSSNTTSDLQAFFLAHPPLVYVAINDTAGWEQTVTFTAPPLGTYEYVCEIPGHFQGGMFGFMGSGVAVGPPPGPPVPVGLYIITGVIVGLVVIAIVLGFVVGKRKGDRYEMPPERLGYPEPSDPSQTGRPPPPFAP